MDRLAGIVHRKTLLLAIGLFLLGIGLVGWMLLERNNASAAPAEMVTDGAEPGASGDAFGGSQAPGDDSDALSPQATAQPPIIIYVSGAVLAPDVYMLAADARTKDAIVAAGGFAPQADPEAINLAAPLKDGQQIQVPARGSSVAAQEQGQSQKSPTNAASSSTGLINVNAASAAELEELPGIGQSLAARIVEYRQANGPFASVEDLRKVRGIGASLFEQIAPLVTVE